jgi:ACS family hexuronate transporter-like MFS transporter
VAIKTVAEWFRRDARSPPGFFTRAREGAVVAPIAVLDRLTWGWPWAFVLTGAIGFVW